MFTPSTIDRNAVLRDDPQALQQAFRDGASRTLICSEDGFVLQGEEPRLFTYQELAPIHDLVAQPVYLGRVDGGEYFACRLQQDLLEQYLPEVTFASLRRVGLGLGVTSSLLGLAFYAQGILNWLHNHRYCSRCGHPTETRQAGFSRQCVNQDCAKVSYPKIDPAVIFSVINNVGDESRILLGRQASWDPMRYAVIAGFVEPGETLEDAVRREALEETGVVVDTVEYVASQSWPFPEALMVGFDATTTQQEIILADQELEHAAWFSAREIERGLSEETLKMPYPISISWHLIDRWFTEQRGYSLKQLMS